MSVEHMMRMRSLHSAPPPRPGPAPPPAPGWCTLLCDFVASEEFTRPGDCSVLVVATPHLI